MYETFTPDEKYKARRKFMDQRSRARKRKIEFKFTFIEWINWWLSTGKWEQRGNKKYQYCMARFDDIGPYEVSNVFCSTNLDNCSTANKGKKHTKEVNLSKGRSGAANGFFGKKHSAETKAKAKATWERKRIEKILRTYQ